MGNNNMEQSVENRKFIAAMKNKLKHYYSFRESRRIIEELASDKEKTVKNSAEYWGDSRACYDEIRRKIFPSNFFLLIKLLEWIVLISGFIYTYKTASYKIQPYLLTVLLAAFYLVATGDGRLTGTIKMKRDEFREYYSVQTGIMIYSVFVQMLISIGVPMLFDNLYGINAKRIGPIVKNGCLILASAAALFVIYGCFQYFVRAKIWMSCIAFQGIGLLVSFYYFWDHMFRCAVIGYENFWIGAYYISLVFSLIWARLFLPEKKMMLMSSEMNRI